MVSQTVPVHESPPYLTMPPQNTQAKLHALQALRGVAALLVVVYHVSVMSQFDQSGNSWVIAMRDVIHSFGKMGVAIFFVLSGFVITYSVFGKQRQPEAADFLLKRLTRIYPPYFFYSIIALLLYIVSTVVVNHSPVDWPYLTKSFLFVPTYDSDGKFYPLLMVGWTLIFEMYFYLLFFLALCCRCTYWQMIIFYIVLFTLGAGVATMVLADSNAYAHVYGSHHLWFFFFGALLFGLYRHPFIHTERFRWAIVLCISVGLVLVYARFKTPIYRHLSLLLFAVSCVAFALTAYANQGLSGKIANKLGIFGDSSYTLYLFHSLAIIVISGVWKRGLLLPPVAESTTSFLIQVTFLVVVLTAISIPLYQLIERPITDANNYRRMARWINRVIFTKKPDTQSTS